MRDLCATCHSEGGSAGHPEIPDRALSLATDLHRLSLSRVLVRQALLRLSSMGVATATLEERLAALEHKVGDPGLEWHRFDLDRVERTTTLALQEVESVYDSLPQP